MSDITGLTAALADRYRIERELGVGGMATVYLARDLKHDRDVALKVLKSELAAVLGADRFVVEIKTTASLQHPHILPLFDSGTAGGFLFYVMPYIAGETIREKLNRETQFGVEEAVRIAREVADALDYAHRHGVIHRDIKPENILLHDGRAMVMDFGIALALSAAAGGRMTETGLSLGTPHYMSPEQATADKDLTPRSDVYSLASVLYEMLTGQPPHLGGSAQQIIMKIIAEPVQPVTALRKSVPTNVAAAVAKALEKLPADRFESAKAFSDALANPGFTTVGASALASSAHARKSGVYKSLFIGTAPFAAVAIFILSAGWWTSAHRETSEGPVRFTLTLQPDTRLSVGDGLAISPNGRVVVFSAVRAGVRVLIAHVLDDNTERVMPGTEGGVQPFFSPDGKWVGFWVASQLKRVLVAGGAALSLAAVSGLRGAAWAKGDIIVFAEFQGPLRYIPAAGGKPKPLAPLDSAHRENAQRWPLVLDDGETVLYESLRGNTAGGTIAVQSLRTRMSRSLDLPGGTSPLAVLNGMLVYMSASGTLMAVPFDARRARITGSPMPVEDSVAFSGNQALAAIAATGTLVFQSGNTAFQVVRADLQGHAEVLVPDPKNYSFPRFSPDGSRIAVGVSSGGSTDIWIYDLASRTPRRLTTEGNNDRVEWTPDGKRVFYFNSNRTDQKDAGLWWQPSDGSSPGEVLQVHARSAVVEGAMSRDGRVLAFRVNGGGVVNDLWYRRLDGDTTPKPILPAPTLFQEYAPRFSPDGKWLVYTSDQSGLDEVYVQAFPALGAIFPVTTGGGTTPVWAPDGQHIYYVANQRVNVATVRMSPGFAVTDRRPLFEGDYDFGAPVHANYDVAPDGKHLLLLRRTNAEVKTVVVHGWKNVLRERTAAGKK